MIITYGSPADSMTCYRNRKTKNTATATGALQAREERKHTQEEWGGLQRGCSNAVTLPLFRGWQSY